MAGGDIYENKAANGAGVYVEKGASITLTTSGGSIRNNEAGGNGGGVYIRDTGSQFFMDGGTVSNNTADKGGGVYLTGEAQIFTMNYSATVSNNTAASEGGGVYTEVPFEMRRGTISGNTAGSKGGGVYVHNESLFIMMTDGSGSITNNKVKPQNDSNSGSGGGVYVSGTFNMHSGVISGNGIETNGTGKGAGVYVEADGTSSDHGYFTKTGGTIHGAMNSNGDSWEYQQLQNYYKWQIGGEEVDPNDYDNIPGKTETGYAIYFDYKDSDEGQGPYRRNRTLTEGMNISNNEGWKGEEWDARDPFDPS
jgi:predicted outer membrane repeat protein